MWERYAQQYRGVCLEYDSEMLVKNNGLPFMVRYSDELNGEYKGRRTSSFNAVSRFIINSILTKNKDYSFEREWRFINALDKKDLDTADSLKRVLVGAKISDDDYEKICKACEGKCEVIRTRVNQSSFCIDCIVD